MILRRASLAALALCAGIAGADVLDEDQAAAAREAPERMLERMAEAVRTLDYQGTIVYAHEGALEVMQLVHSGGPDGERGRLTTVSGQKREVICERDQLKLFLPERKTIVVQRGADARGALPKMLPGEVAAFAANYRITDLGVGSEAGRSCRRIGITPHDALRYGYRLCLDEQTALPLRTELLGEDGKRIIENVVFSQVEFPERVAEAALMPTSAAVGWEVQVQEPAAGGGAAGDEPSWTVATLPGGFAPAAAPVGDPATTHLAFSDGLAAVSVFIEPRADDGKGLEGAARMGAMNLYGRVVDHHQVTVVGEVPAATVRLIAHSVAARRPDR